MGTKGLFVVVIIVTTIVGEFLYGNRIILENKLKDIIKKVDHN